ncbi:MULTISPECIES: glycosyltransferase family 2 protein [Paraburkholderia]|uniref:glycosyltransferase family 2 protein n=1 Tax=Paraburkholderia TaxID=1822464 RepID=UPI00047753D2|nr:MULTISPECIES: glycosyltransferase family 2 protein [Paraburkholderia]MDH6148863.1 GT2 family glycosyltransferase [Paraburkholderia sp. WSM4179]
MISSDEPRSENGGLSVSLVVFRPEERLLSSTLASLGAACSELRQFRPDVAINVCIVDNGDLPEISQAIGALTGSGVACEILSDHGNVGYGRGHNLAIQRFKSEYHLILNPDIDLERDALTTALDFFDANREVGLITPRIGDQEGRIQYLCRRYPTLVDLFIRGFLPRSIHRLFEKRLARYEMRDLINEHDIVWDPPIVSGCFMLFRTSVLKKLDGFDPRYFLYFEDYDLSLRTHELARIAYAPMVRVLHHGGGASRKGSAHVRMFAASAFKFFRRFGWRWL